MKISVKAGAFLAAFMVAILSGGIAGSAQAVTNQLAGGEVVLVKEGWGLLQPKVPAAIERFYKRYFQLDPAAKALFDEKTMRVQFDALSNVLSDVAAGADDLNQFENRMKRLGGLHQNLGAEPYQFAVFGIAFVDTLRLELKSEFKPRARTAWNKIFWELSKMIAAGYK